MKSVLTHCKLPSMVALSLLTISRGICGPTFTPGNLAIVSVPAGGSAAASTVTINQYTTGGTLVSKSDLPSAATGTGSATAGNYLLTESGNATNEGALTVSTDGTALIVAGYNDTAGTANVSISTPTTATHQRTVGLISLADSTADTKTALNNAYSGAGIRGAAASGNTIYTAGVGAPGIGITTEGSTTAANVSDATSARVVNIYNNSLYYSSVSGVFLLGTAGTLPTAAATASTSLLTGSPANLDPYDFLFADNALYVASLATYKGICKYTLSGTIYKYDYTIGTTGVYGLTGTESGGTETLYGTTGGTTIIGASDIISTTASTTVVNTSTLFSDSNKTFRGIRIVPLAAPETDPRLTFAFGGLAIGAAVVIRRRRAVSAG